MNQTVSDIISRRSVRRYKAEQITREELDTVLEAGVYAPTAMNRQSPIIVAVQSAEDIKTLSELNAAVMGASHDPFYGAPTVLVVLADANNANAVPDGSLVMGNLMNAAHAIGLGSCWVNRAREVFDGDEGKALLKKWGIEGEYIGIGNCILGYPDEAPEAKPRKADYVRYVL